MIESLFEAHKIFYLTLLKIMSLKGGIVNYEVVHTKIKYLKFNKVTSTQHPQEHLSTKVMPNLVSLDFGGSNYV